MRRLATDKNTTDAKVMPARWQDAAWGEQDDGAEIEATAEKETGKWDGSGYGKGESTRSKGWTTK